MKFSFTSGKLEELAADCVVLFTTEIEAVKDPMLKRLDLATRGALSALLASKEFSGKSGEVASLIKPEGFKAGRMIVGGLGNAKSVSADSFRVAMGNISRFKGLTSGKKAVVYFDRQKDASFFQGAVEGYLLGSFKMLDFKSGDDAKDKSALSEVIFAVPDRGTLKRLETSVKRGEIIARGQLLVRRLAQLPGNHLTPQIYAKEAQKLCKQFGVEFQMLDEKAIAREKMGLLLAVSQGSVEPPRFLVLKYHGARGSQKPIVLVGKGVTFDAGGISLKPPQDMHEMKGDMTGSAVMLATILTAAQLKLPLNLVTLMPMTENLPSGTAVKPGDVITSRKGLTVEIINTDAEGRLILADALDYANKFEPQAVIDIATLTGAALYVLGYSGAPVVGNRKPLMDQLRKAAEASGERVWEMPLWDDYKEYMKSSFADLVNSGGKPAGTLTASAFLSNFIGDWPWAHIDIAYVDMEPKGKPYVPKGATGWGLRLLVELLSDWKKV
jgi:leucyl aminopeptidase